MSSKGVWRQPRGPTPRATALVALAGFLDRTLGTVSVADVKEAAYTTWQQCAEAAEIRGYGILSSSISFLCIISDRNMEIDGFNCIIMDFLTRRHQVQDFPQLFRSITHLWGEPFGDCMDRPLTVSCDQRNMQSLGVYT